MQPTAPARALVLLLALLALLASGPLGCVTREVTDSIYNRQRVEVILMQHKRGSKPIERGFAHPIRISEQRLTNILAALQIRGREAELAGLRYVFEPDNLGAVAAALSYGLGKADSNEAVAIRLVAKVTQNAIFARKYITSFVSYVQDDLLYVHLSRVDWQVPERKQKTGLPLPRVDEHPMKFKLLPADAMYAEGNYAVSIEWQNERFRKQVARVGSDSKGKRTILLEDDSPLERRDASGLPTDALAKLTPEQLRALADLEEQRQRGEITEGHYRRLRQKIFDAARAN